MLLDKLFSICSIIRALHGYKHSLKHLLLSEFSDAHLSLHVWMHVVMSGSSM